MVPHDAAKRMNRMYRRQRYIYDATRRYFLLGRSALIHGLCPPEGGTVLEIGCGTGWNLTRAASAYPDATLFGFDVSTVMLETARHNIAKSGYDRRISLAQADAVTFSGQETFGRPSFDRIYAAYTLSMIPQWQQVVERALDHIGPRGSFHVLDFGPASGLPAFARAGMHAWLNLFDVVPRRTLSKDLARMAAQHGLGLFHTELHRGYAQYAVLSRS